MYGLGQEASSKTSESPTFSGQIAEHCGKHKVAQNNSITIGTIPTIIFVTGTDTSTHRSQKPA